MHVDFVEGAVAVINGFLLLNQRFNRALQVNFFETHNQEANAVNRRFLSDWLLDSNALKSSTYSVLAISPDCYRGSWRVGACYVLATEGEMAFFGGLWGR